MEITDLIEKYYKQTIVNVGRGGKYSGTGFFIATDMVLTCAHVLLEQFGQPITDQEEYLNKAVNVKWKGTVYDGKIIKLRYSDPKGEVMTKDYALIQVDGILEHPIAVLDDTEIKLFDKCYALGFPEGKPEGESVTLEYEGLSNSSFYRFKEGQIQPGFSGSAILNARTGRVCAIVKRTSDYAAPYGGWGIPITKILEDNQNLFQFHRDTCVNREWEDYLEDKKQQPLKVCLISSEFKPHIVGGLGIHVTNLCEALGKRIDVELILPYQSAGYQVPLQGVTVNTTIETPVYQKACTWLKYARQAREITDQLMPELIHCHDWSTVLAGIIYRWKYKKPLLLHIHLPNYYPLSSDIENLGLISADLVTVNSKAVLQEILDRGLPISQIKVVPNGVNTQVFHPAEDWTAEEPYILFSGRLDKQKGVEYLIRAFFYIKEKFPDISLRIAGDGGYQSYLKRLATNLLISDKVQFLGFKNENELAVLYQKAMVVVVPSVYEPFGMVALEAMACARPVVASRQGGLKELINDRDTGYLAEPENYLDFAQYIMSLLANKGLRQQIGRNAFKYATAEKFRWSSIAGQYCGYYEELLKTPLKAEMDANKKDYALKFVRRIKSVSKQMDSTITDELLNSLFDWM